MKLSFRKLTENEELEIKRRTDDLRLSLKRASILAVVAYLIFIVIVVSNKSKFPSEEVASPLLVGGVVVVSFLVFGKLFSYFTLRAMDKVMQYRKENTID